jgi:DNA helicase-2/ATP-dependent DNA helicase PcrA
MLKHLCIDEAQDLVGDRARLAESIIDAGGNNLGFTVLGDPLQGIYDFQLDDSQDQTTANDFMHRITGEYGAQTRQLTNYYRAQSERARILVDLGIHIRRELQEGPATQASFEELESFRKQRPTCTPFELLTGLLYPEPETTAILCATNYEVLRASEVLAEHDIVHTVRRRAQDLGAAPWIWDALGQLAPTSHLRDDILERLAAAGRPEPEEDWLALKQCEGNSRDYQSLQLQRLARGIMGSSVPVALTVNDEAAVTVSTIHRAKGLEFDNVLYIEPDDDREDAPDFDELTRRTYVALSRARDSIDSGRIAKIQGTYRKIHDKTGRWTEMRFGKPRSFVSRIEISSNDVVSTSPYAPDLNGPEVLASIMATPSGSEVIAVRLTDGEDGQPARYEFRNQIGQALGRSTASFGSDVRKVYYKGGRFDWPKHFTGIRLASVECAAGSPDQTEEVGLGRSGLWLVPRFTGLARAHWKETE